MEDFAIIIAGAVAVLVGGLLLTLVYNRKNAIDTHEAIEDKYELSEHELLEYELSIKEQRLDKIGDELAKVRAELTDSRLELERVKADLQAGLKHYGVRADAPGGSDA